MKTLLEHKGIRIKTLNTVMMSITVIISTFIILSIVQLNSKYRLLSDAQEAYISHSTAATQLQRGSDNLTKYIRYLSETGDMEYIDKYFEEVQSRRRENAVENIDATYEENAVLRRAMSMSHDLMNIEYHIMKLVATAQSADMREMPKEVSKHLLTEEESLMDSQQRMEAARQMAFGQEYSSMKNNIDSNIDLFLNEVLDRQRSTVEILTLDVNEDIQRVQICIISMMIFICIIGFVYYTQVIVILDRFVKYIVCNQPLNGKGAYELRYLASIYNDNREQIQRREMELKHKAEHDDLTGLACRSELQNFVGARINAGKVMVGGLVVIDIDHFKGINDKYGHDTGDRILRKLAKLISSECGVNSLAGRIGGDEFTVWIEQDKKDDNIIKNKIKRINDAFKRQDDGLPSASISAGVSYYEEGKDFHTLFIQADKALYSVKNRGGMDCAVYKDEFKRM